MILIMDDFYWIIGVIAFVFMLIGIFGKSSGSKNTSNNNTTPPNNNQYRPQNNINSNVKQNVNTAPGQRKCSHCGTEYNEGAIFCETCGFKLK